MQFSISIDQVKSLEWGLNLQQATLFSFLFTVPSWAEPVSINGGIYYSVSKSKIAEELPILSGKADTIKRYFQQLEEAGLLDRFATKTRAFFRLTAKAKQWNKVVSAGREKTPDLANEVGKKIPTPSGKKSLPPREKNPTYQNTNNQDTKDHKSTSDDVFSDRFEKFYAEYPVKRSKAQALKAFNSIKPDDLLFQKIIQSLRAQKENRDQALMAGIWVPEWKHPSTWLRNTCWEDELIAIPVGGSHAAQSNQSTFAGQPGKLSTVDRQHAAASNYLARLHGQRPSEDIDDSVVASYE